MTSKNSFTANQKELLKRRLWPIALSTLAFFLYFVVGQLLYFAGNSYIFDLERSMQLQTIENNFSATHPILMLMVGGLAAIFALQGFEWMDSRVKLDFYESQPVARTTRFIRINLNSLFIFLVSYLPLMLLGVLINLANGMMTGDLFLRILLQSLQMILFFYATYTTALLAVMLTGQIVIAVLAFFVFWGYEFLLRLILEALAGSYLTGFIGTDSGYPDSFTSSFMVNLLSMKWAMIGLFVLGTVYLILAYIAYKKRGNEMAGQALVFKPIRFIVKAAIVCLGTLLFGIIVSEFFSNHGFIVTVLLIILSGVIIGCVMQIIYQGDFKALFKEIQYTFIGIALAVLVFSTYYFDLLGFEDYRADPANTEYAVINDSYTYFTDHFLENGEAVGPTSDFFREYMRLTDIDAVNELLDLGMTYSRELASTSNYSDPHFAITIDFVSKSGKVTSRQVELPLNDEYNELYDHIFGSREYKEGYFQIYHDQFMEGFLDQLVMTYDNGSEENTYSKLSMDLYQEFKEAYLKDLEQFDYSFATDTPAIGMLHFRTKSSLNDDGYGDFYSIAYPIYENFTETIAFIEKYGIFEESSFDPEEPYYLSAPFSSYFEYRDDVTYG